MKVFVSIFIVLIAMSSCKNDFDADSELEYKYYKLEKAGWKSKKSTQEISGINYSVSEVPLEYYFLKNAGNTDLNKVEALSRENENERILEVNFLQHQEKDLMETEFTHMDYQKSVEYMSFHIQDDFYIVTTKNDTVQCSGVLLERNFKLAPYNKLLLFFSGIAPTESIRLVYDDRLFRNGVIKFSFDEKITKILL